MCLHHLPIKIFIYAGHQSICILGCWITKTVMGIICLTVAGQATDFSPLFAVCSQCARDSELIKQQGMTYRVNTGKVWTDLSFDTQDDLLVRTQHDDDWVSFTVYTHAFLLLYSVLSSDSLGIPSFSFHWFFLFLPLCSFHWTHQAFFFLLLSLLSSCRQFTLVRWVHSSLDVFSFSFHWFFLLSAFL